jgi:hypothetical protein
VYIRNVREYVNMEHMDMIVVHKALLQKTLITWVISKNSSDLENS